jgi:glycosyltransferase involved in cell wall biosynthesis
MEHNVRVLFCCTGVGIFNRGIESFFRDSFDGLKGAMPGMEVRLLKGTGEPAALEKRVWCLPRTGIPARVLGGLIRRNAYVAEQLSSFPFVAREIRQWKPDVIFYSDANLGFQLYRWRQQIGVPFKLLFSNGGPVRPPFIRTDFVHQVAPLYLDEALRAGEPAEKHFFVPYGINVPGAPVSDPALQRSSRLRLGLPPERQIVLSVGWISREHKRMDYVIQEVAKLAEPRPFLQLLGAMDEKSQEIVELGRRMLGSENFGTASVPYEKVAEYYITADCFVLASLKEGFGRVYLEALMHGLPVIAHRHPVMEYVVGTWGTLGDLSQPGSLAGLLAAELKSPNNETLMRRRWESVRDRFSWPVLAPAYQAMFAATASRPLQRQERGSMSRSTPEFPNSTYFLNNFLTDEVAADHRPALQSKWTAADVLIL